MSQQIPTTWEDLEPFILGVLRSAMPGLKVSNVKPKQDPPCQCVVIRGDMQQKATPISRYARVGIQAWSVSAAGEAELPEARTLARQACDALESATRDGDPLIAADVDSGPNRVVDDITKLETAYAVVLLEVHAA